MDCLYIIIPAYNEEENIKKVVEDWYPVVEKHNGNGRSRLVIIDDGSRDRTCEILRALSGDRELLVPLTKDNSGHGATVWYGYRYALRQKADYIFQTDSDRQTLPGEFEPFWEQRKTCDITVGQRLHRQDGFSRIFVTKALKLVLRITFHVNIPDANTPYRLMSAASLAKVLPVIPENHFLTNVMMSVLYHKMGYRINYRPITFRPRQGGVNSINLKKIIKIGRDAVRDFCQLNRKIKLMEKKDCDQ